MNENVNELLNMIDEAMEEGRKVPFMESQRIVDIEAVHEILDEIRRALPDEIRQAKNIVNDRSSIIAKAKEEAEVIIRRAEERAQVLVSEEQITRAAQAKATEILSAAQSEARQMRNSITDFCDGKLKHLEEELAHPAADMKTLRGSLRQKNG